MIAKKSYFQKVFELTKMIPEGRVSTYGMLADYLALGSARMVGWALNHSHSEEDFIPAHRVVNRNGELTGRAHFDPPSLMQELLEAEGIRVVNHIIIDFEKLKWHPEESL